MVAEVNAFNEHLCCQRQVQHFLHIFLFTKECLGLMVVEGIKCMEAFTSINVKYVNNSILAYKKS